MKDNILCVNRGLGQQHTINITHLTHIMNYLLSFACKSPTHKTTPIRQFFQLPFWGIGNNTHRTHLDTRDHTSSIPIALNPGESHANKQSKTSREMESLQLSEKLSASWSENRKWRWACEKCCGYTARYTHTHTHTDDEVCVCAWAHKLLQMRINFSVCRGVVCVC